MESPKIFYPGEKIHYEEPFVYVLRRSFKDFRCESCFEKTPNLKACKACMAVKYCNKKCQEKNWKDHKFECRHMKNLPETDYVDFVHMLGKVILKLKGKKWSSVQKKVLVNNATFEDLDSHLKLIKKNPELGLFCKEMKALTRTFIGDTNMPDDDNDLMEIIGKVKYNALRNSVLEGDAYWGILLYIGISKFDHACIPSANIDVVNTNLKIWAIRKIKKRSDKITVSFRRRVFMPDLLPFENFLDPCECKECLIPYGESVLTKVLNDKKAYSVISSTSEYLKSPHVFPFLIPPHEEYVVGKLLSKQVGVLGRTNMYRLKLLALKCFVLAKEYSEIVSGFLELEGLMSTVYGEHNIEIMKLYEFMLDISLRLGDVPIMVRCIEKLRKFEGCRHETLPQGSF